MLLLLHASISISSPYMQSIPKFLLDCTIQHALTTFICWAHASIWLHVYYSSNILMTLSQSHTYTNSVSKHTIGLLQHSVSAQFKVVLVTVVLKVSQGHTTGPLVSNSKATQLQRNMLHTRTHCLPVSRQFYCTAVDQYNHISNVPKLSHPLPKIPYNKIFEE